MKNFMMCQFVHHETFVCHEPSELESSESLLGENLVDGLPPVVSFYIIRFEEFENHSEAPRKNREHC